ncbi:xylulokinase [Stella humosa]|uniref:Xylulokinase n=1 Tax=Stella humosa TaxID=94 RepID=A0A3N1MLP4_9PROT|nr:FGGY family carbohydrate kinase [Stella humosa]ROQ01916.1 xylulokinase [Stella humosa]BBK32305.1 carbohydrate kinase [Stella humosa]
MALLVGLDIGTTSTIGTLIRPDGAMLATTSRPVRLYAEHAGWAEEEAEEWWANACAILRELSAAATMAGDAIACVGVTGMLPAVVLLDADDRPIRRSIQQSDARAGVEVEEMRRSVDERAFFARTGCGINQQLVAPTLRWIEKHEPDAFARIATVFGSYDFVTHRLTGARTVEQNWALESGFLLLEERQFADDLLALGGLRPDQMAAVRAPLDIVGGVTAAAAAATGLAQGTPVIAGVADHAASTFAAGVVADGDVLLKFGGSGDIMAATRAPVGDPRLYNDFHVIPGLFMPNGCMAASGAALNWLAATVAAGVARGEGQTVHQALDRLAVATAPGAEGLIFLPYVLGEKTPLHDPDARGVLLGLGLHHGTGHVWRAALEGIAFGFRHHLDVFAEAGLAADRFRASDGGASSRIWMQIVADVIQRPIQLLKGHPGSALGAAFVAGFAIGAFDRWDQIDRFVAAGETIQPNPSLAGRYDRLYGIYREAYERLRTLFPLLAAA